MRLHLSAARLTALLLLTVCAGAAGTACQKLQSLTKTASDMAAKSENEKLGQKLEHYINCVNSYDQTTQRNYADYVRAVGKQGPAKGRVAKYVLSGANDYAANQCVEKLKQGIGVQPRVDELDQSAEAYLSAVEKLAPVVKEAADYYKQEDYKDDNFAKGQQLHPPLLAAFAGFEQASEQMQAAMDKYDTAYKERALAEIEQAEGRKMRYLSREMMVRAKQLLKAGDDAGVTADKLQPALDAYSQSIDTATKYFGEHKDEVRNGACWSSVESQAKTFLKEGKDKLRYMREHNNKPPPPQRGFYSGDRFIDAYNSLITSSNICLNLL